jgi:membrane associated rhomboid family serine protease
MVQYLTMTPLAVTHGYLWQLLTYSFFDFGAISLLFSSLALWTIGGMLEGSWGQQRILQLYFGSVVFAGLVAIALSYTHLMGTDPGQMVYSAWGGVFGLLGAYGTAFAEDDTFFFIFPMKAKWLALTWIGVALFMLVADRQAIFLAELGGALFGYLWVKLRPARGFGYYFSEQYYGVRNRYYRWKRRRAARKFEVYMRKHDPSQYFDQYGNYKPPEDRDKKNGESGKGHWVQ